MGLSSTRFWFALLSVGFLTAACSKQTRVLPIDGRVQNGVYTNAFFAFSLRIRDSWTISNQTYTASMRKQFAEKIYKGVGPDRQNAKEIANFLANGMTMLLRLQRESPITRLPELIDFNSIPCSWGSSRMSAADMAASTDKTMTTQPPTRTRVGEITDIMIGGKVFKRASYSKPSVGGLILRQDLLIMTSERQALQIVLTAFDARDIEDQMELLKSALKFSSQ